MLISDWSSDVCSSDLCDHDDRRRMPYNTHRCPSWSHRRTQSDHPTLFRRPNQIPLYVPSASGSFHCRGQSCLVGASGRLEAIGFWLAYRGKLADRKSTSDLQSLMRTSYAVFCLKKKNHKHETQ